LSLRHLILGLCVLATLALLGPGVALRIGLSARAADAPRPLTYVGSATCASCHPDEAKLWAGSHHKAAMDHATDASVLGDFSGATFEWEEIRGAPRERDGFQ
jgi:hypothetical protein